MTPKSARALMRRRGISTGTLDWIVDRFHVGTPDQEVAANIRARLEGAKTPEPANVQEAAVTLALARHEANRRLYRAATGSI